MFGNLQRLTFDFVPLIQAWNAAKLTSLLNHTESYLAYLQSNSELQTLKETIAHTYTSRAAYLGRKLRLANMLQREDDPARTNMLVVCLPSAEF